MGSAAFVAYLSVLCHAAYTATQYALFSSLTAVGRTVLSSGSGWVADRVDWAAFFLVSTALAVPGLLLLGWMLRRFPAAGRPPGPGR
jgi:PAT family beta-lactamase induction signal transducer AmpG